METSSQQVTSFWAEALNASSADPSIVCRRIDISSGDTHWFDRAEEILSIRELETWRTMSDAVTSRRLEWLLGRWCAKEAVRQLRPDRNPRAVEISVSEHGAPHVSSVAISIAHTWHEARGTIAALASIDPELQIGLDVEPLKPLPANVRRRVFTAAEETLLASLNDEWPLRLWCAKEALMKSVGLGFKLGPTSIEMIDAELPTGRLDLRMADRTVVPAHTATGDGLAFASVSWAKPAAVRE